MHKFEELKALGIILKLRLHTHTTKFLFLCQNKFSSQRIKYLVKYSSFCSLKEQYLDPNLLGKDTNIECVDAIEKLNRPCQNRRGGI